MILCARHHFQLSTKVRKLIEEKSRRRRIALRRRIRMIARLQYLLNFQTNKRNEMNKKNKNLMLETETRFLLYGLQVWL